MPHTVGWPCSWVRDVEQGSTVDGGRLHAQSRWGHVCNDVLCVVCVVCVYTCVCVGGRAAGSGTWSRAALWTEEGITLSHVGSTSVDESVCVLCVCTRVCVWVAVQLGQGRGAGQHCGRRKASRSVMLGPCL